MTPSAQDVFELRCWARARLWREGEFDLPTAVDELQQAAVDSGLVETIGQDAVQAIMAAEFADPPEIVPDMVTDIVEAVEPEPRGQVAVSVLWAAEYLIQQNDPERLRKWLAGYSASERAAILDHIERKEARS